MKRLVAVVLCAAVLFVLTAVPAGAKTKAPPSCLRALSQAESVVLSFSEFASDIQEFFDTLKVAAQSSYSALDFVESLTTASGDLATKTNAITAEVLPKIAKYRHNAAKCRNAGY